MACAFFVTFWFRRLVLLKCHSSTMRLMQAGESVPAIFRYVFPRPPRRVESLPLVFIHSSVPMFTLPIDAPPALPLWIDGHAVLTLTERFIDVCDPHDGRALRRVPVCREAEVARAVVSAREACAGWSLRSPAERAAGLVALADALGRYAEHFAGLLGEEAGLAPESALSEVAAAQAALRACAGAPGVVAGAAGAAGVASVACFVVHPDAPFAGPVHAVSAALAGGASVVLRTAPSAPSVWFALAELSARCAFPPGVFNLVHGDGETADALALLCANSSAACTSLPTR